MFCVFIFCLGPLGEEVSDAEILRHGQLQLCGTSFQETRTLQPIRSEKWLSKSKNAEGLLLEVNNFLNGQMVLKKKKKTTLVNEYFPLPYVIYGDGN